MALQVVKPRSRGFIHTTAHPGGCEREVRRQIDAAHRRSAPRAGGNLLVVGGSTGYGLASRIAGAFGHGMDSVSVFFERPPSDRRTASAGWYNTAALEEIARQHGRRGSSINGDAFSNEVLDATVDRVRRQLGPLDIFVYSLAAPVRKDPDSGKTYRSAIKTIGPPHVTKTIDLESHQVVEVSVDSASDEEIAHTVAVMGGGNLRRWVDRLLAEGLLAPGARVVSYSYIGPELTWPIYRHGTIGRAKIDLEQTSDQLHERLQAEVGGSCLVAINPSVVTQAAAAIPGVPLGMSILFGIMKEKGVHEQAIALMIRLFDDHLATGCTPVVDEDGRIRLDDVELRADIQAECAARWARVITDNLYDLTDYEGYRCAFQQLFGFEVEGVDYDEPVETDVLLSVD